MMTKQFLIDLFRLKAKFAASSAIATTVDYCLYLLLLRFEFTPEVANICSAGTGMIINFILQKNYIFDVKRRVRSAFMISLITSIIGISLSTLIIHYLTFIPFFAEYQFITKALATGIIFFYNFYCKRFAFEKKLL